MFAREYLAVSSKCAPSHGITNASSFLPDLVFRRSLATSATTFVKVEGSLQHLQRRHLEHPGFHLFCRFNRIGLYVVMFLEILSTLLKVMFVFSVLIIAFGLSFHILLAKIDVSQNLAFWLFLSGVCNLPAHTRTFSYR